MNLAALSAGADHALLTYWLALKLLLIVVAVLICLSSTDDLFIDLCYWLERLTRPIRRLGRRKPSEDRLRLKPEQRIAIMVPAWREAEVIANMLVNTINAFDYTRFDIFVGVYQNDPDTRREVERVQKAFPNVHLARVGADGPTCKADCLNWILEGVAAREAQTGEVYEIFAMHDAEDVVHPFGLRVMNWFIEGAGMIQLPVLSMNRRWNQWVACHYLDEFAEFHTKDLPVRALLSRMTPSAGVATAFSREALQALSAERAGQVFNTASLTEDYDIGHRLKALGFSSDFIRYYARTARFRPAWFRKGQVRVLRRELVATKEFFPHTWRTSVRQKARWMLGISYMGWAQLGWFGDLANRYFLFRDRKALFTAPVGALAYLILISVALIAALTPVWQAAQALPPLIDRSWVVALLVVNALFLLNRMLHRAWFTARAHGIGFALLSPVRIVVSNLIGFAAFGRSMRLFVGHLITGRAIAWDKTQHAFPGLEQLRHRSTRLGELLRHWNQVSGDDLHTALMAQKHRYRPLGLLLVERGAVTEEALAAAFAEQAGSQPISLDVMKVEPRLLHLLTARQAARFRAVPVARRDGVTQVALAEPLDKTARRPRDPSRAPQRPEGRLCLCAAQRHRLRPEIRLARRGPERRSCGNGPAGRSRRPARRRRRQGLGRGAQTPCAAGRPARPPGGAGSQDARRRPGRVLGIGSAAWGISAGPRRDHRGPAAGGAGRPAGRRSGCPANRDPPEAAGPGPQAHGRGIGRRRAGSGSPGRRRRSPSP
ncbi:glycosyl transferase family protein [Phenylobacterium aquaticum]|uniref:glycosyl transferase family protein n=1 Tax=Phenylobacterium aquaticum TaxID=1763816 RepID=UPI001F5CE04D|nr:glycosyl transferase family protein [Phenylobacterium aquaticum]MCI3133557.1 glycosyl transferase family protein [Phenylobacterium aquaticum]